jgi:ribosomal protein S19
MKALLGNIQNFLLNNTASYLAGHELSDFELTYSQVSHRYDNQAKHM